VYPAKEIIAIGRGIWKRLEPTCGIAGRVPTGYNIGMAACSLCGRSSSCISRALRVCLCCIRESPEQALMLTDPAHGATRSAFGLPERPPQDPQGLACSLCVNECRIAEGGLGYCGVRQNVGGRLKGVSPDQGKFSWYHDPLPTNCVADWVCPGGTGAGYPEWAHDRGPEQGYANLAVFFQACSFDCLYCQNWRYREQFLTAPLHSAESLAACVDRHTSCICFFGGDPAPQLPFALRAAGLARQRNPGRILRICWETAGAMAPELLDPMVEMALSSGGCIKFDLKAWDENLHRVLVGTTNKRTLDNFQRAAARISERPNPPLLVASTLLVPGYVDEQEVKQLAGFLAAIDTGIPYSLLGFHPQFVLSDLPPTSKVHAQSCLEAARSQGLTRLHIGNRHVLV
jgi:pyruvate formate lyase activating enzyme